MFIAGPDMRLGFRRSAGGPFGGHATLANDLISYWMLDEVSGVRVDTITATGNDLTDNNTVASDAGIDGLSASFLTANVESLTRLDPPTLRFTGSHSFSFWFYGLSSTLGVANYGLISKQNVSREYLHQTNTSGFVVAIIWDSGGLVAATNSTNTLTDSWHHIIVWYDSGDLKIRVVVDGGAAAASAALTTGDLVNSSSTFELGQGAFVTNLTGRLDEMGVWSRALTSQERTDLWNGGAGRFY